MEDLNRLRALSRLTEAVRDKSQAEMAALKQAETALRDHITALAQARHDRATETATDLDHAIRSGVDMRWHTWIDQRRAALTTELARNLAAQENARAGLAQAVGRNEAVLELIDRTRAARAQALARRASYTS